MQSELLEMEITEGMVMQDAERAIRILSAIKNLGQVENRGVDIQTGAGEAVRACFDGRVQTVTNIAGMNTIVMIQHGDFFTVYAKLRSVSVSVGQRVSAREVIGTVATDTEGTSEVQFQVWHNSSNLNPESWLGHR